MHLSQSDWSRRRRSCVLTPGGADIISVTCTAAFGVPIVACLSRDLFSQITVQRVCIPDAAAKKVLAMLASVERRKSKPTRARGRRRRSRTEPGVSEWRVRFGSGHGTFETCRRALRMSGVAAGVVVSGTSRFRSQCCLSRLAWRRAQGRHRSDRHTDKVYATYGWRWRRIISATVRDIPALDYFTRSLQIMVRMCASLPGLAPCTKRQDQE